MGQRQELFSFAALRLLHGNAPYLRLRPGPCATRIAFARSRATHVRLRGGGACLFVGRIDVVGAEQVNALANQIQSGAMLRYNRPVGYWVSLVRT